MSGPVPMPSGLRGPINKTYQVFAAMINCAYDAPGTACAHPKSKAGSLRLALSGSRYIAGKE